MLRGIRTLVLTGLVILAAPISFAQARTCQGLRQVQVSVQVLDPAPQLRTLQTLKQINSKAKTHGLLKRGNRVFGLTQSEFGTTMEFYVRGFEGGGRACVNVERVNVTFGHKKLAIFVPQEYPRGSCRYKVVLRHENAHVRVFREGVRKYAKILKRELNKAVKRFNPQKVRSMADGQKRAGRTLQKVIKSVVARLQKEERAQHARIDTPGSPYDSAGTCRNW